MPDRDREPVITHLQIIKTWAEFAHEHDLQFFTARHLEDIAKWAEEAIDLLKEQQEAVVRCSDCKHGEKANSVYLCGKRRGFGTAHEPDFFCADGERKEGSVKRDGKAP